MCMNCGCGEVNERHGNEDNIVAEDVIHAAKASGLDVNATVRNLQDSLRRMGGGEMATSGARSQPSSSEMGSAGIRDEDASRS